LNSIYDYSFPQFKTLLAELGEKSFRATQIFAWLYQKRCQSFEEMSNLSKEFRQKLGDSFSMALPLLVDSQTAPDGTIKFLSELQDGERIETVILRHHDHNTVCLSTQVGCGMGCKFCLTATMGLKRDLTPGEIVGQVLLAYRQLESGAKIRNLVYMGMGEPFHNYENSIRSLEIFTDKEGLAMSWRRITISTSGLVPEIIRFGKETRVRANLAISLNGVTEESRSQIMPITKRHSLEELIQACRAYPVERWESITFEYVLLKGITDDMKDAKALVKLLEKTKAKVNLIPFNENEQLDFQAPTAARVRAFQQYLLTHGLMATIRTSRGQGISAACGQLASQKETTQDG